MALNGGIGRHRDRDGHRPLGRQRHGARVGVVPLGQALLAAINPKAIVISAGTYPYAEMPSPALLERLAKRGVPVFSTLTDGGIEFTIRRTGEWHIQSMHGRKATGPDKELKT